MKHLFIVIGLLGLLLTAGGVSAQDTPLLMLVNGADVWAATPAGLTQVTTSGYNDRPIVAPNGQQFASKVIADVGIEALRTTGGLGSELPSDIELYNPVSGASRRIATQPADATFNAGQPARAILRSAPAWSPNGAALAWTEDVAPDNVRQLVIFDVGSGQQRVVTRDLPLQAGFQRTLPVRWGSGGIAVKSVTADASGNLTESILIFDPNGGLRANTTLTLAPGEFVYEFVWINDGAAFVGVIYSTGRFELIDPATGGVAPLTGTPELFSVTAPGGLAVQFSLSGGSGGTPSFVWQVNGQTLPFNGPLEWITIAPGGDQVAYMSQGTAFIWRDGQAAPVTGTTDPGFSVAEVAWGPTAWRIRR